MVFNGKIEIVKNHAFVDINRIRINFDIYFSNQMKRINLDETLIKKNFNSVLDYFTSIQNMMKLVLLKTLTFVLLSHLSMKTEFAVIYLPILKQSHVYLMLWTWKRFFERLKFLFLHVEKSFKEHGTSCWVAGWGHDRSNGVSSNSLKAIGVNLFDREYCMNHRFVR